ncbi:hypothetical protein KIN20_002984 [Parelaphostrongylus tenuis]|uniref:Uncharacterized protein n=1 Tax=Parelaphostrongylus tenuis TaxID=148309 RepID=A0AAD5QDB5_PARTN|nr:hypothetical protein KIN20_002984 [Parelaphostrongylus tenuis]
MLAVTKWSRCSLRLARSSGVPPSNASGIIERPVDATSWTSSKLVNQQQAILAHSLPPISIIPLLLNPLRTVCNMSGTRGFS